MIQIFALGAAAIGVVAAYLQSRGAPAPEDAVGTGEAAAASSAMRVLPRNAAATTTSSSSGDIRNMLTGSRRDYTPAVNETDSLDDRLRFYNQATPKTEVRANQLMQSTPVANVHVRNDLAGLRDAMLNNYDIATAPHKNVTPIATTTGTAHQLVGPGLGLARDAIHGDSGFHYGMVRIRPPSTTAVHPTTREQRGVVAGGAQAIVKNYTTQIGDVLKNLPERSFVVGEDYLASSNGRSAVVSAAAPRLLPQPEWRTTRGETSTSANAGPAVVSTGALGPASRTSFITTPDSGNRGSDTAHMGVATGAAMGAYTKTAGILLPAPQRGNRDVRFGVATGGDAGATRFATDADVNNTQRGTLDSVRGGSLGMEVGGRDGNAGASSGAQRADRAGIEATIDSRNTQRAVDADRHEYRNGAVAGPTRTGAVQGFEYERGVLMRETRDPTMRDLSDAAAPWRAGAATAAASGGLAPARLGYVNDSTKELASSRFVAPAGKVVPAYEPVGNAFERAIEAVNASRGVEGKGGVQRQATSNYYVRNIDDAIDGPANKMPTLNTRLDPSVLYALTQNEWVNPIVKA